MYNILVRTATAVSWFFVRYAATVGVLYVASAVPVPVFEVAGFAARILVSWLAVAGCALFGVFASIALRLAGGSRWQSSQWATARAFKYTMAALTGVTFVVEDPHNRLQTIRPAVFVGNHQTAVDLLMLGCMFPPYCSVTAKRSLRNYPFLGWFMRLSGTIFIDRANRNDSRAALRGAADAIRSRRQSVYMFPEGTRSYSQEPMLLPFKKGAFHLAVQAGVPIVPVVVANYSHVYSAANFRFHAGRIPIKVLDPIPTSGLTADDVTDLATRVHDLMLQELVTLTMQARAGAAPKRAAPVAVPAAASTGSSSTVDVKAL